MTLLDLTLRLSIAACCLFAAAASARAEPPLGEAVRGNEGARIDLQLIGRRVRPGSGSMVRVEVRATAQEGRKLGAIVLRQGREVNVVVPYGEQGRTATATLRASRIGPDRVVIDYLQLAESYTLN